MASVQANIDLVVRGSNAVNRLIEDVSQLESAVRKVNSRTLEIASKTINSEIKKVAETIQNLGASGEASRLTRQQESAVNQLTKAQNRFNKAVEASARAEQQLIERGQRRTKSDSQAQRNIESTLNRNRAAARAAADEIRTLNTAIASTGRQLASMRKLSIGADIPKIRELIKLNEVSATQRAVRVLAQEFNRLGDSARASASENSISRTILPKETQEFSRLANQLEEARKRAQQLKNQLSQLRRQRTVADPGSGSIEINGDDLEELQRQYEAQQRIRLRNQEIEARNEKIKRERPKLGAQLRQENNLIAQLEMQALSSGTAVLDLQQKLASLAEFRYRDEPTTGLKISLNQIQAQAESLALVANNSSIASDSFRQFTVAAEVASVKLARAQQSTFAALAAGLSGTDGEAPEGLRQNMGGARGIVSQLIADIPGLTRSEAALNAHIQLLTKIRTILPFLSLEYRAVEEAIAGLTNELEGVGLRGQTSKIDPGAADRAARQAKRSQDAADRKTAANNALLRRQLNIEDLINKSNLSQQQKTNYLNQLNQAANSLAEDRLYLAKDTTAALEDQVRAAIRLGKALTPEGKSKETLRKDLKYDQQLSSVEAGYKNAEDAAARLQKILESLKERGVSVDQISADLQQLITKSKERKTRADKLGVDLGEREVKLLLQQVTAIQRLTQFTLRKHDVQADINTLNESLQKTQLNQTKRLEIQSKLQVANNALAREDLEYAKQLTKEIDKQIKAEDPEANARKAKSRQDAADRDAANSRAVLRRQAEIRRTVRGSELDPGKKKEYLHRLDQAGLLLASQRLYLSREATNALKEQVDLAIKLLEIENSKNDPRKNLKREQQVIDVDVNYENAIHAVKKFESILTSLQERGVPVDQNIKNLADLVATAKQRKVKADKIGPDVAKKEVELLLQQITGIQRSTQLLTRKYDTQTKINKLSEDIAEAGFDETKKLEIQNKLKDASNALAKEGLEYAKQLTEEAEKLLRIENNKNSPRNKTRREQQELDVKASYENAINTANRFKSILESLQDRDVPVNEMSENIKNLLKNAPQRKTKAEEIGPDVARKEVNLLLQEITAIQRSTQLLTRKYGIQTKIDQLSKNLQEVGFDETRKLEIQNKLKDAGNALAREDLEYAKQLTKEVEKRIKTQLSADPGADARKARSRQDVIDRTAANRAGLTRRQANIRKTILESDLDQERKQEYLKRLTRARTLVAEGSLYLAREATDALKERVDSAVKLLKNSGNDLRKEIRREQQVIDVDVSFKNAIRAANRFRGILKGLQKQDIPVGQISENFEKLVASAKKRKVEADKIGPDVAKKEVGLLIEQITASQRLTQLLVRKYDTQAKINKLNEETEKVGFDETKKLELQKKLKDASEALARKDLGYAKQLTKEVDRQIEGQKVLRADIIASGKAQRGQLEVLKDIGNRYQIAERAGVAFGPEKTRLETLTRVMESGFTGGKKFPVTPEATKAVGSLIGEFRRLETFRTNQAKVAGAFTGRGVSQDPVLVQSKQIGSLLDLQRSYAKEKAKGVQLSSQEIQLNKTLKDLMEGRVEANLKNVAATGVSIKFFRNQLTQQVLQAKAAGLYQSGSGVSETVETRLRRVSGLAYGTLNEITSLERQGLDLASNRLVVEEAISEVKKIQENIEKGQASGAMDELGTLKDQLSVVRQLNKDAKNMLGAGLLPGAGLKASLNEIAESKKEAESFLGKMSPEQAIDKVVRAFGAGGAGGMGGAGGAGNEMNNVEQAARSGAEALLGLRQLKAPSKATIAELKALSNALEGIRVSLNPLKPGAKKLDAQLRNASARIERNLASRDPGADFLTRTTRDPRTANAISEGLIGGVFPLLFGQGVGASVFGGAGGAAGGFLGGGLGFGLSLAGTALGTMFDQLAQAAQETGKSLNYPIEGFERLKEANLFSSRAQEYYISKLIETGQTGRATAEIQAQMIRKIGVSGVNDLMDLGEASSNLSKAWAEFNLELQAALAGPMAGLLNWVAGIVAIGNRLRRDTAFVNEVESGLTGKDLEQFRAEISEIRGLTRRGLPFGGITLEEAIKREKALAQRFSDRSVQDVRRAKQDPAQQEAALQAQRQVADEIKSAYREGFQLQQQIIDLERKQIDIRRRIENEIFARREQVLRLQIDNDRKRAQVAIDMVDLEYQRRIANEEGRAAQVLAAEAELVKVRAQGEADMASARKILELDIARQQRETQNYIYNLEREAESMRRETLGLEMQILDYRQEIERKIQDRRLVAIAQEAAALRDAASGAGAGAGAGAGGRGAGGLVVGGAFDTGLRTGPSEFIGGGASYHQDLSFGPTVTLAEQRKLILELARAYERMGKEIVLSNAAVYGRRFPLSGTVAQQNEWILSARAAHRSRNNGRGRDAIDFYAVNRGESTWSQSAVNAAMYAPIVQGATAEYRSGGPAGAQIVLFKDEKEILRLMHGDIRRTLPANRRMPEIQGAARPVTAPAGPSGSEIEQLGRARNQIMDRLQPPQFPSGAGAAMTALDRQEEALRRQAIDIQAREAKINEQRARDRLYEASRGPIEIQQAREKLGLAVAEFKQMRMMSDVARELLSLDIAQAENLKNRKQIDDEILANTKEGRDIVERGQEQAMIDLIERNRLEKEAARTALANRVIGEGQQQTQEVLREIEARKLRNRLLAEGVAPEITEGEVRALAIQQKMAEIIKSYDMQLAILINRKYDGTDATYEFAKATLAQLSATTLLTEEQKRLKKELEDILASRSLAKDKTQTTVGEIRDAALRSILTPRQQVEERVGQLKQELRDLLNPAKEVIGAANAISDAFGESFQSVITGAASAQEALGNFFQRVANHFIDMAAKIAANEINQSILGLFRFASPSTGVGAAASALSYGGVPLLQALPLFANGGVFSNSVVASPTLFKFANGGVTEAGVMGEAGPEAIMPLKRGPGGRLGVAAFGPGQGGDGEQEDPYQESFEENRRALAAAQEARMKRQAEQVLSSGASSTEIKYNRVGTGDLPFVTEETMLEATRLAAEQGAKIGQRRTLAALRNDPAARRSAGLR